MVTISLLYYSIIDLVTSSKKQAVRQALSNTQIKQHRSEKRAEFKTDQEVVKFVKNFMKASEDKPLMNALKDTEAPTKALRNGTSLTLLKQAVYKRNNIW